MAFDRRPDARALRLVTHHDEDPGLPATTRVLHAIGGAADRRAAESVASALRRPEVEQVLVHADPQPSGELPSSYPATTVRWLGVVPAEAHGERTAALLQAFEVALTEERPDVVVTYGATGSALACALAAAKLDIAIAHLGSGAPDATTDAQVNRAICQRLADTLLAPDDAAAARLTAEGVPDTRIHVVGDGDHPEHLLEAAAVIVAHYVLQVPGRSAARPLRFPRTSSLHA